MGGAGNRFGDRLSVYCTNCHARQNWLTNISPDLALLAFPFRGLKVGEERLDPSLPPPLRCDDRESASETFRN